jgi:hypothetical protein
MLDEIIGRANKGLGACLGASSSTRGFLASAEAKLSVLRFSSGTGIVLAAVVTGQETCSTRQPGEWTRDAIADLANRGVPLVLVSLAWVFLRGVGIESPVFVSTTGRVGVLLLLCSSGRNLFTGVVTDSAVLRLVAGSGIEFVAVVARERISPNVGLGEWTRDETEHLEVSCLGSFILVDERALARVMLAGDEKAKRLDFRLDDVRER